MFSLLFSNIVLSSVTLVLLLRNRNWHLRSLLILVLCSNLDSILRNSLFPQNEGMQAVLHRVNVWLNIGIGYFTFLMVHDAYQNAFGFLQRHRLIFIRYLTIVYGFTLIYFLTQDNFIISMISYGLPVVLMFLLGFLTKPMRGILILGSAVIIGSSLYLSLAPHVDAGIMRPSDVYHYGLAVGLAIFHRAFNAEYHT